MKSIFSALRTSPWFGAAAACALLTACAPLNETFHSPEAPTGRDYLPAPERTEAGRAPQPGGELPSQWWQLFPSPALDALIREAIAGNPTLRQARASLEAAVAQTRATQGGLAPSLDLSAQPQLDRLNLASFGFSGGPFPNNPHFSLYSVGAMASYPVDVFGGLHSGVEAAQASQDAQSHEVDAALTSLTGQTAAQAATLAALSAELDVVDQILADDRENLAMVRAALRAGGEPRSAQVSAQSQLAADESLRPALVNRQDAARHGLTILLGKSPSEASSFAFSLEDFPLPKTLPVSLPSDLVHRRPDILAAEARLHAAAAEIGVATAKLYPQVTLSAQLTQSALQPEKIFDFQSTAYTLLAGVTQPVIGGGVLKAGVTAAKARRRQALAAYQATVLTAFGQVADLLSAVGHDEEALDAQRHSESLADQSLALARKAYGAGATGLFPVIDASRQLNSARLARVRADAQLRLDLIALFVASGKGVSAQSGSDDAG